MKTKVPCPEVPPEHLSDRQAPSPLADAVSGVWAWHSDGRPTGSQYALADGCTYLLLAFGAAHHGRRDLLHARVIGPRTKPFLIDDRPRLCIGVRFVPGFARMAFGIPASELLDQRVDYDQVSSNADADLDSLHTAATDMARVTHAVALARRRLGSATGVPAALRAAVAQIGFAGGNLRIGPLADRLGVTRQHLARHFATHVGMTAKQFARVKRAEVARTFAAQAARAGKVNWSVIAHRMGYYDQAHFIRDFRMLTGLTPGKWIR